MGVVGIEPTHPEETDLQSAATLQLRRTPISNRINFGFINSEIFKFAELILNLLAGVLGIEPRLTESKSVLLPLQYTPTKNWSPVQDSNLRYA